MEFIAGDTQKITVSQPGSGTARVSGVLVDRVAILITTLVVAFSCCWSTAKFDVAVHEFALFQAAPDEPFYLSLAAGAPLSLDYRFASRILIAALRAVGITSFDWIALAYQAIFPPLAFFTALVAARCLATRVITRLVLALLLCLAFDLLSGSSAVVANPPPTIALAKLVGKDWLFRPDVWWCFPIFRRPEPEVSFCVLFLYFFGIVHSLGTWRPLAYRFLCLATPFTCLIYISTALISLLVFGMASLAAALFYHRPLWRWFIPTLVVTVIAYALAFSGATSQAASAETVFLTHLPTPRPSMIWSMLGIVVCVLAAWRNGWRVHPRLCLAFIFFLIPFCTLNQQIITGRAVMAQAWEIYGNYVCVVMAAGLLAPFIIPKKWLSQGWFQWAPAIIWALLIVILLRGEVRNEGFWALYNVQSLAQARVYREAVELAGPVARVVLPHLWDESLFVVRVKGAPPVFSAYGALLTNAPSPWTSSESFADHLERNSADINEGFETLARRGLSVPAFRASLDNELASGNCWPTLMYFFSLQDCLPVLTNFQSRGLARLRTAVDPLGDAYAQFLRKLRAAPSQARVLAISYDPLPERFADSSIVNRFVAKTTVKLDDIEVTAYAYLQTSS